MLRALKRGELRGEDGNLNAASGFEVLLPVSRRVTCDVAGSKFREGSIVSSGTLVSCPVIQSSYDVVH